MENSKIEEIIKNNLTEAEVFFLPMKKAAT